MGLIKVAEISIDKLEDRKTVTAILHEKATLSDGEQFTPEEQVELRWKFIEDLMGNTKNNFRNLILNWW